MRYARDLVERSEPADLARAERGLASMMRIFAQQAEALKRYRSRGQQTVTVQHQYVEVGDGGQAIVGQVTTQGATTPKPAGTKPSRSSQSARSDTTPTLI